jgi:hypothetical protein
MATSIQGEIEVPGLKALRTQTVEYYDNKERMILALLTMLYYTEQ